MEAMLFDCTPESTGTVVCEEAQRVEAEGGYNSGQHSQANLRQGEREICELYQQLGSVSKVAKHLGIRPDSASNRLSVIRSKLGLSDIRELLSGNGDSGKHEITAGFLLKLIESQDYRCALTGRELTPETATLDHKHPQAEGGDHERENVWWIHEDVNRAKGTMSTEDFIRLCRDVASYAQLG